MNSTGPSADRPYYYKLFRVKRDDGRVTTVSVDPVLVAHAVRLMGGLNAVGKFVREAALNCRVGDFKSCSDYVARKLETEVTTLKAARPISQSAQRSACIDSKASD